MRHLPGDPLPGRRAPDPAPSGAHGEPGSLDHLLPQLVSPVCGLITDLRRVNKDPVEPERPYIYRAEVSNHTFAADEQFRPLVGSGKGFSPSAALSGAIGEAVERYCASVWHPSRLRYAAAGQLPGRVLDPRDLVLYEPSQYTRLNRYAPYSDSTTFGWVAGRTWGRSDPIWLPAIGVFLTYQVEHPDEFICPVSSNGLACASHPDQALAKAACELIEREAFMLMWHHRITPQRLDVTGFPDAQVLDMLHAYERRGVQFELYRLRTDLDVPVCMALGVDASGSGPAVVVGLGADPNLSLAARSAMLEVAQVRPALRIRMRAPETRRRMAQLYDNPMGVAELEDHDLLYADARMTPAFDFIRQQAAVAVRWPSPGDRAAPSRIGAALAASGLDLHYIDVTPADIRALGLSTVRAIVPDMQPIHFGANEIRLGGDRFYRVAAGLLGQERQTPRDVDRTPHPLS